MGHSAYRRGAGTWATSFLRTGSTGRSAGIPRIWGWIDALIIVVHAGRRLGGVTEREEARWCRACLTHCGALSTPRDGGVSRAAKGADCKASSFLFVAKGHSEKSPEIALFSIN